jgi:hypothetical protein
VQVWNTNDLMGDNAGHMGHMAAMGAADPKPIVSFRPFSTERKPLVLAANYQGSATSVGVPTIVSWVTPRRAAFTTISLANQATTHIRTLGRRAVRAS